mgnify:CR=1 FL=1
MPKPHHVVLVEDHCLIAETWSQLINSFDGFQVIAQFKCGEDAIKNIPVLRPDIVLLDINLPGINGIVTAVHVKKALPSVKIIGLSLHTHPAFAKEMMKSGADAYVTKSSGTAELKKAMHEVISGRRYVCKEVREATAGQPAGVDKDDWAKLLSGRELEVIQLLKQGATSKQIAATLNIATKTVEVHRHNILRKSKVPNTAALINYVNHKPNLLT